MAIYTSAELKSIATEKRYIFENKLFSAQNEDRDEYDIFLSHSYLDKEDVKGLYLELTGLGYSVYVDWIVDPELNRNNVTKESAELIRKRMKSSKSLLLAISENASISKWIPWELGYVDGNTNKCAIIPVSHEHYAPEVFNGKEYLKLYPFVKKSTLRGTTFEKLWVVEGSKTYSTLKEWQNTGLIFSNRNINIY